jgi:sulfate adenylyltransferase subunit 1 (EFTu-like GTPase family)
VKLPTVPLFRVHHTTTRSALLVWPRPKELQGSISYEVEVRTTLFNPASRRPECVWVPAKKMKLTVEPTYVTAEVRGLLDTVDRVLNLHTLLYTPTADPLRTNDLAHVRLRLAKPLATDAYTTNRVTGAFILVDESTGATVAAGMISSHA